MNSLIDMAIRRILVRATNWVGDAVMTLPALTALARNYPGTEIHVLAKPWVGPVYADHPAVTRVIHYESAGRHKGLLGRLRLARELAAGRYDLAVLFQNAFEAALLARLAGIPRRLGYATDGRGRLLTHPVLLEPGDKEIHETRYYLRLLGRAGLCAPENRDTRPVLHLSPAAREAADRRLTDYGPDAFLLALAPGAAYGPAKRWPADRFAAAADRLLEGRDGAALVFGSPSESDVAEDVVRRMTRPAVNLAGQTGLSEAAALIARARLFLGNDSGLMHIAAAVGVPVVGVFGSTDPTTTAPAGERVRLVRRPTPCAPCLKTHCTQPTHACMEGVTVDDVAAAGRELTGEDSGNYS